MKKLGYVLLFGLLVVFSVPSLREKSLNLIFTGSITQKGVTIDDIKSAQNKNYQTFSSKNLKVTIHAISSYSPSADAFKFKEGDKEFYVYETSIENISNQEIDPSWFMATYFIEDAKGNFYHNYLDQMTGYYQENPDKYTDEIKSLIDKYYGKTMPAKTAFASKLFFFPVPIGARITKVHFDDPVTHERNEFALRK